MPLRSITIYADIIKLKIKRKKESKEKYTLFHSFFLTHTAQRGRDWECRRKKKDEEKKK